MIEKVYQVKLKVYGPVHIGSGKIIRKQEYIYDRRKSLAHIVDGPNLVKFLNKKGKFTAYLQYLNTTKERADLYTFLRQEQIDTNDWKTFVLYTERVNQGKIDMKDHNPYSRTSTNRRQVDKGMNDLHLFVRDGRGDLYIPGSSLKGALRTVLEGANQSAEAFHSLSISDSLPIDPKNLAIYQKIDINKELKPMPLYRECVNVGTTVEFTMKINSDDWTIEKIEKQIQQAYLQYWNKWFVGMVTTPGGKAFIKGGGLPSVLHAKHRPTVLFLGGGTGFPSKTTHYLQKPKEQAQKDIFEILQRRFRNVYGKMATVPKNVPMVLKGTVNDSTNKWYQQGVCLLEFQPIGEA